MLPGNHRNDPDDMEDDDLRKSAPNLFGHEKKNPFSVPENYFDSLPSIIQDRIQKERKESWFDMLLKGILRPQFTIAIMALIIITLGGIYYFKNHEKQVVPPEMAVSDEDLKILNSVDESTLIDELTAYNEGSNLKSNDTEIENYIIDNQTDINQIINEL